MTPKDQELARYLHLLQRRKWLLAAVCAAVLAAGYLYTARLTPLYQAKATVLIDHETPRVRDELDLISTSRSSYREYYNTQVNILKSRRLADKAAERFGGELPEFEVGTSERDRMVTLGVLHADPRLAALAANTVARTFVEDNMDRRVRATGDAQAWLSRQLREAERELQEAELALENYRRETGQVSLDQSQDVIVSRLSQLNSAFTGAQAERVAAEARYSNFRRESGQVEVSVPEVFDSEFVVSLRGELAALQTQRRRLSERYPEMVSQVLRDDMNALRNERRRLRERYTESHPEMVRVGREIGEVEELIARENEEKLERVSREIAALQAQIEQETEEQRNRMVRELEREQSVKIEQREREYRLALEAARDRENQLREMLREQEAEAMGLSSEAVRFNILKRSAETRRELHQLLLRQAQNIDLSGEIAINNISIVDEAREPDRPVFPNTAQNLAVSALLGLVLGTGMVFFADYLDDRLRGFEELREGPQGEGLRLLTTVPHLNPREQGGALETVTSRKNVRSHAINAFRMMRTNLLFPAPEKPRKTILVTSSISEEGKTFVACNAAIAFAQIGSRTLLVDGDLHKPQLAGIFGLEKKPGLTDYLAGEAKLEEVIRESGIENLWVTTGGGTRMDSEQLISSGAILEFARQVRERYDCVVFDSSPLLLMPDASFLNARAADATIMVVRAGRTPRRVFERAAALVREAKGATLAGIVFNDASRAVGGAYYYDKYEYYGYY